MRYSTAPMCRPIKIVTAGVIALGGVFLVASLWNPFLLPGAGLLFLLCVACYLRAPIAYDISRTGLTVVFRLGTRHFGPIVRISPQDKRVGFSFRLWGNGGLFAGTGIFWNRTWGLFRAYVTTSKCAGYLLVETPSQKVLISPSDPAGLFRQFSSDGSTP
ncbi:MAG: PH domain-containing protein [Thermodesulfobacteriota bacterium]